MDRALYKKTAEQMEAVLEHLKRELASLRTGRASVGLLDNIRVEYHGKPTPLKQVASLAVPESRLITIQPWEPSLIKDIEKAILNSDLGLTPSNDGKVVRIPVPPLTEERRKDLVKVCKKYGEEAKVRLRAIRHEANNELKKQHKEGKISEDDRRRGETEIQKVTDQYAQKVDQILKKKEEEILEL
jgi:ribosome recycling factor